MPHSSLVCEGVKLVRVILVLIVGFIDFRFKFSCSFSEDVLEGWDNSSTVPYLFCRLVWKGEGMIASGTREYIDIQLSFAPLQQHFTVSLRCPRIVVMYPHIKPSGGAVTEESVFVSSSRRYSKKSSEH